MPLRAFVCGESGGAPASARDGDEYRVLCVAVPGQLRLSRQARARPQLGRELVVLGEGDVPVPPVLVVARPVLLEAARAIGLGELRIKNA